MQQTQEKAQDEDVSIGKYGDTGLIQSKDKHTERKFTDIKNLNPNLEDKTVWIRGRLHTSRAKGISLKHKVLYIIIVAITTS